MEEIKRCPYCAEDIRSQAIVCRYCGTDLLGLVKEKAGRFVKVRVKTREQIYAGEIFVPDYLQRVSDVLNDKKSFIVLTNTTEENKVRDVPVGFIAVNKSLIEWIRLVEGQRPAEGPGFMTRTAP